MPRRREPLREDDGARLLAHRYGELVAEIAEEPSFATRHMFEYLMKREAEMDPTSIDYEGDTLEALAAELKSHDNLKLLVKALVKLPQYRRMP